MKLPRLLAVCFIIFGTSFFFPSANAATAYADVTCANQDGTQQTYQIGWDTSQQFFEGKGYIPRLFCEVGYAPPGFTIYISDNLSDSSTGYYNGVVPTPAASPSPEPSASAEPSPSPTPSETATVVTETATAVTETPTVVATPSPEPSPQPSPLETQTVLVTPSETPTQTETVVVDTPTVVAPPSPAPEPTPIPDPPPVVQPEPVVVPQPQPTPEPAPEPPSAAPEPAPEVEAEAPPVEEEPPVPEPEPDVPPEPAPEPEIEPELPPEVAPEEPELPEPEPDLPPVPESEPEPVVDLAPEPPVEEPEPPVVVTEDSTPEEREAVAEAIIEAAQGQPVTAQAIQDAGLTYEDLPPETPVEVRQDENGNEVVITAEIAAALVILADPAALVEAIFTDPAQALLAIGSIGADMSDEERTESEKIIVASVIAGQAAVTAAAGAAGAYRRKP